ncbi:MAG TPA: fumarylacetoacetate hydrolase family protein [Candidatus Cybelea sp.]|nr:fumarylacetoacetate hydrolase family protein [Candidatus Cybelea sp.]
MNLPAGDPNYVIAPQPRPALAVADSPRLFPVRRIYCVGRNYAEHAKEMGHDPTREPPFFFQKNPDSIVVDGVFPYPSKSKDVHHEIELVVALASGGCDIDQGDALNHIFGYAVGLDMTRRDLQGEAKKLGRPWEVGKAFDHAAPCSAIRRAQEIGHPAKGEIRLAVNGAVKQRGDLSEMIWSVPEIIAHLSGLFELQAGDLIFTGTPAGVGPVARGDRLEGSIAGVGTLTVVVG